MTMAWHPRPCVSGAIAADFDKSPAWTSPLAELHRIAVADNDSDTYFALAELSFLHAVRTNDRGYALMTAIYAWSFLYGGEEVDPYDPRLRLAANLYNRGLTLGLEDRSLHVVTITSSVRKLPIGLLNVTFDPVVLEWNGRHLHDFIPIAELKVQGLENRFRTPGIGAPLAASAAPLQGDAPDDFLAPA